MERGYRNRFAQPELEELQSLFASSGVVALVDYQQHVGRRIVGEAAAQQFGDLTIGGDRAGLSVDEQKMASAPAAAISAWARICGM